MTRSIIEQPGRIQDASEIKSEEKKEKEKEKKDKSYLEFEQNDIRIGGISPDGRDVEFAGDPEADVASGSRWSGLPEDQRGRQSVLVAAARFPASDGTGHCCKYHA